jgi:LysM repeat protein
MFAKTLLALPFVAYVVSAQDPSCTRTYTVQPNDICDSISAANNVSTYQLAVVNIDNINPQCSNLVPYSSICLGWAGEDCTTTYVVQLGDTCDEVAAAWGLNTTIFYLNNPQLNSDCTNLYIGEVVCTSPDVLVPPAPSGTLPGSAIPPTATPAPTDLPYCDEI